jgi:hypothetical protein
MNRTAAVTSERPASVVGLGPPGERLCSSRGRAERPEKAICVRDHRLGNLRACLRWATEASARIRSPQITGGTRSRPPRPEGTGPGPAQRSLPQMRVTGGTTRPRPFVLNMRTTPRIYVTSRHSLVPIGLAARNSGKHYVTLVTALRRLDLRVRFVASSLSVMRYVKQASTLPDVPPSVGCPSGLHRQRCGPKSDVHAD